LRQAVEAFRAEMWAAELQLPRFTVISNVDALPYTSVERIKENLIRSVADEVVWHASSVRMLAERLDLIVEFGASPVLTPMLKRIASGERVQHVGDADGVEKLRAPLAQRPHGNERLQFADDRCVASEREIRLANSAGLAMLGYGSLAELNRDLVRQHEALQVRPLDGEPLEPRAVELERAVKEGRHVRELALRNRATGHDVIVRSSLAPSRAGQSTLGAVRVTTDLTERLREEKEPFDDPLRQKYSANWAITKPTISEFFTKDQQATIRAIFRGCTSEVGYQRLLKQMEDDYCGF